MCTLSEGIWGLFDGLFTLQSLLLLFYFESQAAEVLRRPSSVQPAVAGTFTSFLHNKMDWNEEENVSPPSFFFLFLRFPPCLLRLDLCDPD